MASKMIRAMAHEGVPDFFCGQWRSMEPNFEQYRRLACANSTCVSANLIKFGVFHTLRNNVTSPSGLRVYRKSPLGDVAALRSGPMLVNLSSFTFLSWNQFSQTGGFDKEPLLCKINGYGTSSANDAVDARKTSMDVLTSLTSRKNTPAPTVQQLICLVHVHPPSLDM